MNNDKLHPEVLVSLYSKVNTLLCKWQYEKWCRDDLKVEEPTLEDKVRRCITMVPQSSEDVFIFEAKTKEGLLKDINIWLDKMTVKFFSDKEVVNYSLSNDCGDVELDVIYMDKPNEDEYIEYQEDKKVYQEMVRIKPIVLELYRQTMKEKTEQDNKQILAQIEELKKGLK